MLEKTIAHLNEKNVFDRLRKSTALTDTFFKIALPERFTEKCLEECHKEAYKEVLLTEFAKDKDLLKIVLDEITDELIKNI